MPSKIPDGETRGWIVPIGGAENKENDRHILERFVRVSGGAEANIVVIPTASRMHETGPIYEKLFKEIGAAEVAVMDFDTRRDCQEPGRLRRLGQASGIFFTGGNQLRLTTLLGGTPVAKLIRVRNAHGVTVGGTSAGASILSEHMIAFGDAPHCRAGLFANDQDFLEARLRRGWELGIRGVNYCGEEAHQHEPPDPLPQCERFGDGIHLEIALR